MKDILLISKVFKSNFSNSITSLPVFLGDCKSPGQKFSQFCNNLCSVIFHCHMVFNISVVSELFHSTVQCKLVNSC